MQLQADGIEDLWHTYHLVCVGDLVESATFRKARRRRMIAALTDPRRTTVAGREAQVTHESSSGSVDSQRVKMRMTVEAAARNDAHRHQPLRGAVRW